MAAAERRPHLQGRQESVSTSITATGRFPSPQEAPKLPGPKDRGQAAEQGQGEPGGHFITLSGTKDQMTAMNY